MSSSFIQLWISSKPVDISRCTSCIRFNLMHNKEPKMSPTTWRWGKEKWIYINEDRHVNFVRPSIRSHSVLFVVCLLNPAHVTLLKVDSTWAHLHSIVIINPSSETQGQSVGSGERARRKFSSTGERAPGYWLSPRYFQKFQRMPAPDWAQNMLCIIVPNRRTVSPEFFSWVRTRRLLYCHTCPVRSPSLCEQGKLIFSTFLTRSEGTTDELKKRLGWTFGVVSAGAIQFAPGIFCLVCLWLITKYRR